MKIALIIALVLVSIVLIISVLLQPSKANGLSGFVGGGASDTFFSKNKAKTYEVMLSKVTAVSAFIFAVIVVLLNVISKS